LGKLFGGRKTVVRGGFSVVYDRQNTVQSVIIPTLGIGFGQTLNLRPLCNATSAGGTGCDATSTNSLLSVFRVGRDGTIPTPTVPAQSLPASPFWGLSPTAPGTAPFPNSALVMYPEVLSFQVDPSIEVGKNYAIDFTWQREMPFDMILEFGYIGRFARLLPQSMNFGQVPYTHVDSASGQSFAQAYDAVALQVRAGVASASIPAQAWFTNNVPGGTQAIISTAGRTAFNNGNVSSIFESVDRLRMRNLLPPFSNYMAQTLFMRSSTGSSNYNGAFFTLNKRMSRGLMYTVNYTFSRSLDQFGNIQNAASVMPNNFDLNAEYGPSPFDINHVLNVFALYELPFGKGRWISTSRTWLDKIVGGWFTSSIFTSRSGDALVMTQGSQVWGGSGFLGFNSGMIPTVNPFTFGNTIHDGATGSGGIGTNSANTATSSRMNLFADPAAVFNSFRRVELSRDGRAGRANPIRGLPRWNVDMSFGKKTGITERVSMVFSVDFFNFTNHADFNNPSLDVNQRAAFGVITSQFTPPNRTEGSRWIQFGLRVEF
jgi:hypothetical protein